MRIAGESQVIHRQGHPRHSAAGLDGGGRVRIARRLFARTERAGVAAVPPTDAPPVMNEGVAILGLARDAPKLKQALQVVQAFPTRARRLEIFASVQPGAEVIAGAFPVLFHFAGHPQVPRFAREPMKHGESRENRHIHLRIARVQHAPASVEISVAD